MESNYVIKKFSDNLKERWDKFIFTDSINGTFLQSRRFLDYHPIGRFTDASLVILDKGGNFVAVIPAIERKEGDKKIFFSHGGSTFGGIVVGKRFYVAHKLIEIVELLEEELKKEYDEVVLKITPSIFAKEPSDLMEYVLYYKDYERIEELNAYIDFADYGEDIVYEFAQGKRTNVNNCIKAGVVLKKLNSNQEIEEFYNILCETLEKYDRKPVHSIEELLELKNERLQEETAFYGAYLNDKMVAGSMMFYFNDAKIAHTQYLCALHEYDTLSPMTYMYYAMIKESRDLGYKKVSFGISSEHDGKELNFGLTKSKEAFGGKHSVNRIYKKKLKV